MASILTVALAATLPLLSRAQQMGTAIPEVHPKMETAVCTQADGCTTRQTALVTDALARPFHLESDESVSCSTINLNASLCSDAQACARQCVLEGVQYGSIGVLTKGTAVTLRQYLPNGEGFTRVSPRVYLLAEDEMNYEILKLLNKEITFDVDLSRLSCGMNGALYLSEMDASGNRNTDYNPAGAAYGTGYCDAQCFNVSWINGLPNLDNSGNCCNEMDIWEANREATVFTPHTCSKPGSFLCTGDECGRAPLGVCDKPGCGVNPYRLGVQDFYGVGKTIDTSKPFTVVTQFITSDGTDAGDLAEIRRIYYQGGRMITSDELADATRPSNETSSPAPAVIPGIDAAANAGAVTQDFCVAKNSSDFLRLGGMKAMGESLRRGMVLIFSIWNSDGDFMNWLDSGENGPCSETEGNPELILRNDPDVSVTFMNVRWGEIGSTTMNLTAAGRVAAQVANGNALGLSFAAARPGVGSLSWMLVAGILVWFLA